MKRDVVALPCQIALRAPFKYLTGQAAENSNIKMMTPAMKQKIDGVLDRVKEPETGLSIAQLGLVERIRYSESNKKLSVILSTLDRSQHKCCTIIQGLILSSILEALTEEFDKAFPELAIEIV